LGLVLLAPALALPSCQSARHDDVTLRFWAMGREGEVVAEQVRDFERENPGIHVDLQQIPWSAAHEKLLTGFVGHSTPDLTQLGNTWIAEFHALGALESLAPWVAGSRIVVPDRYFPGIWATNVVEGTPYGIPWYVDTRLLFYRKDILARAGYTRMPERWDEWRRMLVAVKRQVGPNRYAILLPANEWTQPMIFGLQAGAALLVEHDTRGAFSAPAFKRAFDFYLGLFHDGLAPPVANTEISNIYQEFERGYFSLYITGPWNIGEFDRRLPASMRDAWGTAPLPGPEGAASGLSMAGGSSLAMFRQSAHKAEAWRLIEYLSRPEQQVRFFKLCGDLPARREAWSDSALVADRRLEAFRVQLGRVAPWPMVPEMEQIAIRLQELSERAIRGQAPPDSVLAEMDRDVDQILEKRRWLMERREQSAAAAPPAPSSTGQSAGPALVYATAGTPRSGR